MAVLLFFRSFAALLIIPFFVRPITAATGGRSFSASQLSRAGNHQPLDLPKAFARNLFRYGGEASPDIVHSAEAASVLASAHAGGFVVPVSVGASTLYLTIDTGSSDLIVFSSELSRNRKEGPAVYKPSVYSSRSPTKTWAIRYADGSFASGGVYYDVVGVEGIWVMQQAVEVATNASSSLAHSPGVDGILGLGFGNLNKVKPQSEGTFFDHAKLQLESPLFAAGLKQNGQGGYDFGFVNRSRYNGELSYIDVDSSHGHWSFGINGFDLGNGEIINDSHKGVIDTGASLIYLPDHLVRGYYQQVDGASNGSRFGEWTVPCSSFLPSFTAIIDEYKAVVLGDLLKLGPLAQGSSQCLGGIQSNMNAGVSIFGHVFLKTQYVVFDHTGPRLGFATQS